MELESKKPVANGVLRRLAFLGPVGLDVNSRARSCRWTLETGRGGVIKPLFSQPDLLRPLAAPAVLQLAGQERLAGLCSRVIGQATSMVDCEWAGRELVSGLGGRGQVHFQWYRCLKGLDAERLNLALASRHVTGGGRLPVRDYNLVWQHQSVFREVADHCPGLLPILAIWLKKGNGPGRDGIMRDLKGLICKLLPGCGPAAWRWLLRHGAWPIRPFWRIPGFGIRPESRRPWDTLVGFLWQWCRAGFPPPLPASLGQAWANSMADAQCLERACPVRLGLIAREADRRRRRSGFSNWSGQALQALKYSEKANRWPDTNQVRRGWAWVEREMRTARADRARRIRMVDDASSRLPDEIRAGRFLFVVLKKPEAVAEEGHAMDNCLQFCRDRARYRDCLNFSIRDPEGARRIATCSLRPGRKGWSLADLAGHDNGPVCDGVREAADGLVGWLVG